jgi:hypothetical protein
VFCFVSACFDLLGDTRQDKSTIPDERDLTCTCTAFRFARAAQLIAADSEVLTNEHFLLYDCQIEATAPDRARAGGPCAGAAWSLFNP